MTGVSVFTQSSAITCYSSCALAARSCALPNQFTPRLRHLLDYLIHAAFSSVLHVCLVGLLLVVYVDVNLNLNNRLFEVRSEWLTWRLLISYQMPKSMFQPNVDITSLL